MLKSQDIVVSVKLLVHKDDDWTYRGLAEELKMSYSGVHDAVKRAEQAGLLNPEKGHVISRPFLEFLQGGLRYVYYTRPGRLVRGIPTAHSGPPLQEKIRSDEQDLFVWPEPEGRKRGQLIEPLYHTVPEAVQEDQQLYEWLNLLESIRVGRTRERNLALEMCEKRLKEER